MSLRTSLFYSLLLVLSFNSYSQENGTYLGTDAEPKALKDQEKDILYKEDDFYFITGEPDSKVFFSFSAPLIKSLNFHGKFDQTMFWKLFDNSSPIRDITFNPSAIIEYGEYNDYKFEWGLYSHHSNGKKSVDSRAFDQSYLNIVKGHQWGPHSFSYALKFYGIYNLDNNNHDIREYKGFMSLRLSYQWDDPTVGIDHLKLKARLVSGGQYSHKIDQGHQMLDFQIKPQWPWESLFKLHFQFFHGYGESLLGYNVKETSYRIGLSL